MTITEIKVRPSPWNASLDYAGKRFGGSATVVIDVRTSERDYPLAMYVDAVASTVGPHEVPVRLQQYQIRDISGGVPVVLDSDTGLFCQKIDITNHPQDDTGTKWVITCNYAPLEPGSRPSDSEPDPLLRPGRYWLEFREYSETVDEAWNIDAHVDPTTTTTRAADTLGPIANTAGQDYDEALQETDHLMILCCEKNFATLQEIADIHNDYHSSLNSNDDYYTHYDKMQARYEGVTCSQPQYENGAEYYRATVRVALSSEPFTRDIVNRGYQYYKASTDELIQWDGSEPALLKANGEKLPDGELGNVVKYRTRRLVDYTNLI